MIGKDGDTGHGTRKRNGETNRVR